MGIYMQVYNFGLDEKTQKPAGSIEYEIDRAESNEKVMAFKDEVGDIANASGSQVNVEKTLPLQGFESGAYRLRVSVIDRTGHQTVEQVENFTVGAE